MASDRRAPLSRQRIIETARNLISSEGLDALTLRRLADTLSVSAPTLYDHLEDKEDLLRSVAELEFDLLMGRYEEIANEVPANQPLERIRAQFRTYVRRSQEDPELFRVMFLFPPALGDLTPGLLDAELPAATKAFAMAVGSIEEAIRIGELSADQPLTVALSMWAGAHGVASLLLLGLAPDPAAQDALVTEVANRILAGYGATQTS